MKPGNETTVEEWENRFRRMSREDRAGSDLPIEMLFSQAYRSLSGSAQLAIQFALSQVSWEKTKRPGKRKNLKNDTIYLPTNALIALGIKERHEDRTEEGSGRKGFFGCEEVGFLSELRGVQSEQSVERLPQRRRQAARWACSGYTYGTPIRVKRRG